MNMNASPVSASSVHASAPAPVAVSPPAPQAAPHGPTQEPATKRVVVPRCAAWFALDKISAVEKRMLPEFFEHDALHRAQFPPGAKLPSSKTPQIYMKYRNYMVHAYRQQPHVYLTATACRRNLAGDACAIMRVHEFLTHWGIINYDVPPHAMPPALHANYALKAAETTPSATPAAGPVAVLVGKDASASAEWLACERCGSGAVAFELTAEAKKKLGAPEPNGPRKDLPLTQSFGLRPGSGVCDDCYLARSFPEGIDASDFVRLAPKASWTREEDALLMEAVATGGGQQEACDWTQIAGKVKTKSAEECVVRFLELPLLAQATGPSAAAAAPRAFAYAESVNASVIDMAALVRDVDPFVAKAAARAAIHAINELHKLPPREVAPPMAEEAASNGTIKQEASEAPTPFSDDKAAAAATETGDVDMGNGAADAASGDDKTSVETAAAAVASTSETAGIVAIKSEPGSNGDGADINGSQDDVDMGSGEDADQSTRDPAPPVTKETVAVVQEAAHATAAALMATRAHKVAKDTAEGPVRDLVTQLLQNQLQQLELKMQQISVLEKALMTEKEALTRERHAVYMDRLAFAHQKLHGGAGNSAAL